MERFYGFDLGDAESAVARLEKDPGSQPEMLRVADTESFITAYSREQDGQILVGEQACYSADAVTRKLRFKSRFLKDPAVSADVRAFAGAVLGQLYQNADLIKGTDTCFYVGCPAGWDKNARERYRSIFEKASFPPQFGDRYSKLHFYIPHGYNRW